MGIPGIEPEEAFFEKGFLRGNHEHEHEQLKNT
jgi:hypothetical protein